MFWIISEYCEQLQRQILPDIEDDICPKAGLSRIVHVKCFLCFSKYCYDVFDIYHEQAIIAFEIDGNGTLGIEQDFIVLTQWYIRWVLDLSGNSYDSTGYCWDFYVVGQLNAAFGLFFILVFTNQDAFAYRLDYFESFCLDFFFFTHFARFSVNIWF